MKSIKVLGMGCASCQRTYQLIEQCADSAHADVELSKVEDLQEIMEYGVLATPGVVVDGVVVHSGGVPDKKLVLDWLGEPAGM